jgi:hypothetical protein
VKLLIFTPWMVQKPVLALPRSALSWVWCFCVVDFDVEYGQRLQAVIPENAVRDVMMMMMMMMLLLLLLLLIMPFMVQLAPVDHAGIAMLSMPECHPGGEGDSFYCFKVRLSENLGAMFGYVLFRRRRSDLEKRGFFQQSVVLLSPLPFFGLYKTLMAVMVGPLFFAHGPTLLEASYATMQSWPAPRQQPQPQPLELPFLGEVIR